MMKRLSPGNERRATSLDMFAKSNLHCSVPNTKNAEVHMFHQKSMEIQHREIVADFFFW